MCGKCSLYTLLNNRPNHYRKSQKPSNVAALVG